jgi:hypothetical protein
MATTQKPVDVSKELNTSTMNEFCRRWCFPNMVTINLIQRAYERACIIWCKKNRTVIACLFGSPKVTKISYSSEIVRVLLIVRSGGVNCVEFSA